MAATPLQQSSKTVELDSSVVVLVYLQSAVTVHSMGLVGVTTLGGPGTTSDVKNMKMFKVDGGLELRKGSARAFIPDGNVKVAIYG